MILVIVRKRGSRIFKGKEKIGIGIQLVGGAVCIDNDTRPSIARGGWFFGIAEIIRAVDNSNDGEILLPIGVRKDPSISGEMARVSPIDSWDI